MQVKMLSPSLVKDIDRSRSSGRDARGSGDT
jgi:hypothetical protein